MNKLLATVVGLAFAATAGAQTAAPATSKTMDDTKAKTTMSKDEEKTKAMKDDASAKMMKDDAKSKMNQDAAKAATVKSVTEKEVKPTGGPATAKQAAENTAKSKGVTKLETSEKAAVVRSVTEEQTRPTGGPATSKQAEENTAKSKMSPPPAKPDPRAKLEKEKEQNSKK